MQEIWTETGLHPWLANAQNLCFSQQNHKITPAKMRSVNPFCAPRLGSSQAVITRDLVNGGNMQCDRRFSSCGCGACQADGSAQRCRAASAPIPCHCQPCPPQAPGSPLSLQRAQDTWHTHTWYCQHFQPLPNKAWLQRTCYSIILCGLFVWNTQLPQIRNLLPHGVCFILFL